MYKYRNHLTPGRAEFSAQAVLDFGIRKLVFSFHAATAKLAPVLATTVSTLEP